LIEKIDIGTNHLLNTGSYRVQYSNGNTCIKIADSIISIPELPVLNAATYQIDFTCETGYSLQFDHISDLGLLESDVVCKLVKENVVVYSDIEENIVM